MGRQAEAERRVWANDSVSNLDRSKEVGSSLYNDISTSKYSLWTFVPQNLFEQFSRLANAYFLMLVVLQFIDAISSLDPTTTAVPLAFVLAVTMFKDGYDDYARHRSDGEVNSRLALVLRSRTWEKVAWKDIAVGDIVRLKADDAVPADMVLLSSSSDEPGEAYIETADLDGETNLKLRRALPPTRDLTSDSELIDFDGKVFGEPPNTNLNKFVATLHHQGEHSLNNDALLLRGCVIRQTHEVNGLVVYAGKDTKLMQNSGRPRFKRTHIDKQMNILVLYIFLILVALCSICAILSSVWERDTGDEFTVYLERKDGFTNPSFIGFLNFFSYVIVLNSLVPLSLYVSIEIIRLGQSMLINWDTMMYHEETNSPARARSTTLNEELGQIHYVFSDKTGTLTENIMKFVQMSVDGEIFGKDLVEEEPGEKSTEPETFIDDKLQQALQSEHPGVTEFFEILAVCHTVEVEKIEGVDVYQAASPDEKALVEGARDAGFQFMSRTQQRISITKNGDAKDYELLNILEFNSTRKRMSVIVRRPDGSIVCFSKGADTIMFDLLSDQSKEEDLPPVEDHLHEFAKDGLRTLVIAKRELTEEWYDEWTQKMHGAETSLEEREEKIAEVALLVERDLKLVGASAIEDKLQPGVPGTIANLMAAGIKVWVLTGDKQETAINIGASARLLTTEMDPLLIVNGRTADEVEEQLRKCLQTVEHPSRPFALVIDGPSLLYPLPPTSAEINKAMETGPDGQPHKKWTKDALAEQERLEDLLVQVARQCVSVVCCRVSPLQKSQVVRLIKKREKANTLAIGDGANDVSMIKAAHIGVGISGLEGRQAVLAADYSLAQFRFLERLLLVHGRWSYRRMTSFLGYFFEKNFMFTLTHFWFAFFCGYSAQTLVDQVFIAMFNVVFASLPIIAVGLFEQDVSDTHSVEYPFLYEAGLRNYYFTTGTFMLGLLRGAYQSLVVFFAGYFATILGGGIGGVGGQDGQSIGNIRTFGTYMTAMVVIVVNLQVALETQYWTWMNFVAIVFGPASWLILFGFQYSWEDNLGITYVSEYYGVFNRVMASPNFWAIVILGTVIAMLPMLAVFYLRVQLHPTPVDIVREKVRFPASSPRLASSRGHARRSTPTQRSSFAFSPDGRPPRQSSFAGTAANVSAQPSVRANQPQQTQPRHVQLMAPRVQDVEFEC
eukprot:m.41507 g.41507  ORF g.41507 m.41507 type:complete len:1180 (+) comp11464_c0_seq3:141-3680(+)